MKFATIRLSGQAVPAVEASDGSLLPLAAIDARFSSLKRLIELGAPALETVRAALKAGAKGQVDAQAAQWAPPIPDPSKMLFVALNNSAIDQHLSYRPDFPAYFPKLPSALLGAGDTLQVQPHHGLVHPEPELGVVIGRMAREVPLGRGLEHVFGFTIVDDVTSVGMRKEDYLLGTYPMPDGKGSYRQVEESYLYPGRYKNVDGYCPMGPFIWHKELVADPMNIQVRAYLDDELVIEDNTRNLHYSLDEVIYWVSHHSTLLPGDIISLGTAVDPDAQSKPLSYANLNRRGEVVRIEFEGLGSLSTPVQRVAGAHDPREHFAQTKRFTPRSPA